MKMPYTVLTREASCAATLVVEKAQGFDASHDLPSHHELLNRITLFISPRYSRQRSHSMIYGQEKLILSEVSVYY